MNRTKNFIAVLMASFAFLPSNFIYAQSVPAKSILSLPDFLVQVKKGHGGYVSSQATIEGNKLRGHEQDLLTMPSLIGSAQYLNDKRESGSPLQGDEMRSTAYSLGIRKTTEFGLETKILYNHVNTSIPGANPTFVPERNFYVAGPAIELSQALGRNWLGVETKATKELISAQVLASQFAESFRQKQLLAEAESAYWRLAVAREAVAATKETVARARKLKQWSSERARLNLGNRTDFLQTEANFLGRNLEFQAALDEEKSAARGFNTMRGLDSEEVFERIAFVDEKTIVALVLPEKSASRESVKAAEQQKRLADANSRLGAEKNKPNVSVYGSYGLNGRDVESSEAIHEANSSEHPNYTIGLRVDIPLGQGTQSDVRQGYHKEAMAADLAYQRKVFEEERTWKDLSSQFKNSLSRYQLSQQIEKAQKEKLTYERVRQGRGLTTTFQVLQFEQDFANSQIARLRIQAEVLNVYSQLKTFGGAQ